MISHNAYIQFEFDNKSLYEGPNLIMDGRTSWVIQANYFQSSLERGHLVSSPIWTLVHYHHPKLMTHRMICPRHNEELTCKLHYLFCLALEKSHYNERNFICKRYVVDQSFYSFFPHCFYSFSLPLQVYHKKLTR